VLLGSCRCRPFSAPVLSSIHKTPDAYNDFIEELEEKDIIKQTDTCIHSAAEAAAQTKQNAASTAASGSSMESELLASLRKTAAPAAEGAEGLREIEALLRVPSARRELLRRGDLLAALAGPVKAWGAGPLDAPRLAYWRSLGNLLATAQRARPRVLTLSQAAECLEAISETGPALGPKESHQMYSELARAVGGAAAEPLTDPLFRLLFPGGLRNLTHDAPATRALLMALISKLKQNTGDITASTTATARARATATAPATDTDTATTTATATATAAGMTEGKLSNAVYGLRRMAASREVLQLLALLTRDLLRRPEQGLVFQGAQLSALLYGLNSMSAQGREVRDVLTIAARALGNPYGGGGARARGGGGVAMTPRQLCAALYGLRGMDMSAAAPGVAAVRRVMRALGEKIGVCGPREAFSAQSLSMALTGMQGKPCADPVVGTLMTLLGYRAAACPAGTLGLRRLAGCFMGLRGMRPDTAHVKGVIRVLTHHLSLVPEEPPLLQRQGQGQGWGQRAGTGTSTPTRPPTQEEVGARPLCNILYSMNSMSSDSPEVCRVLTQVTRLLSTCRSPFRAKGLSNAVYGLRFMSSEVAEVRAVAMALAPHLRACRDRIWDIEAAGLLLGMQRLNSGAGAVLQLVGGAEALLALHEPRGVWPGSVVSNCMYGMMRMSSRSREVCRLLGTLLGYFQYRAEGPGAGLSSYQLGRALYGMRWMEADEGVVRDMLGLLAGRWARGEGGGGEGGGSGGSSNIISNSGNSNIISNSGYSSSSSVDVFTPAIAMNCILGTSRLAGNYPEYLELIAALRDRIRACPAPFPRQAAAEARTLLGRARPPADTHIYPGSDPRGAGGGGGADVATIHAEILFAISQNTARVPR
jgi:hypothetical protein